MDLIDRQQAIDELGTCDFYIDNTVEIIKDETMLFEQSVISMLKELPSAEPVLELDEWCMDCKEYDHEKNCCPRFNRVIKSALKDAEPVRMKGKWIDESVYKQTMDGKTWDGYTYCSECREMHEYGYRSRYCPNCGARMLEGEQDATD